MGSLYRRGKIWWIKYYIGGRPIRQSARTESKKDAKSLLADREGRVVMGSPVLPRMDRITFLEAAEDLIQHYSITGSRNLKDVFSKLKPVRLFFDRYRLTTITQSLIMSYIQSRQLDKVSNAQINRETSLLGKALRLAHEKGKLTRVPRIHSLKETAPRSGFFEQLDFERVRRHLSTRPDLQLAITLSYTFGWRMQSEVLPLTLTQVDLDNGTLRLDAGETKNGEGRLVYLTPELHDMIKGQIDRVKTLSRDLNRIIPYLFPNPRIGKFHGEILRDFRKAWTTACRKAGLAGKLRHDFRRSAVRNLVRSGVPETVAMKVTGHKTRSVFDRYDITSDADLREATSKLSRHNPGTNPPSTLAPTLTSTLNSSHAPVAQLDRAAVS